MQVRQVRDGTEQDLTAAYVVACDGHDSALRRMLGVPISRKQYPVSFVMGDFPDATTWQSEAHLFFSPRGSIESFPLPHNQRRWIALTDCPNPDTEVLVAQVRTITGCKLEGSAELWHSSFTPERILARSFFRDRVVLCGDAAHVMSPIGGQGMNTGFADAWNLASVLRKLHQAHEPHAPMFAGYESNRRHAFRIAANRAARGMWLGTRTGQLPSAMRAFILRHALSSSPFSRYLATYFSMLSIPNGEAVIPFPFALDADP